MSPEAPVVEPAEAALRAANARLRDVLDGIGEAFYTLDREWRLVHASRKALELWGKRADEVLGRTLPDIFPRVSGTEAYQAQQRAFETGRPEHLETFSHVLDRWIELDVTPGRTGLSVAFRDIDARKRTEQALRESEDRWRLVVESATDYAIITMDLQGRITGWSPGAACILGWPAAEALGQHIGLIFPPEDRAAGAPERAMRDALATGHAADDCWHLRRDGSRFWATGQITPLRDGRPRGFLKILRDHTERRQAEEALAAAHARTMSIIESIDNLFYIVDRDWRLTHVGRKALKAWGKRADEVIGLPLLDVLPLAAGSESLRIQMQAAAEGRAVECEVMSPTFRRWLRMRVHPAGDAGTLVYFRDIHARKEMEEALRESEERFRSFAENSADALWIMDAATRRLIYLSPAFERIWGEPREAIMRDLSRWAELVHPEDAERAFIALPRLLADETHVAEYRIRRPDGGVRWIRNTGFPIRDADGGIIRVAGIAQDVTEERRAEAALRSSEAWLRALSETIPQLVWTSLADGQWDWAGPQWQAYTGLSGPASFGHGWRAALHPDDQARAEAAWWEASGEGRSGRLDVELRLRRHDGAWRWFQARAVPLPPEDGAGLRWFGTCTDMDDLKLAEEALRASEARFRAIADAMPQILWSAFPDGCHDYFNRRWYEYTGQSRERTAAEGWTEIVHPDDLARTRDRWERSLRTGELYEIEYRLRGIDGSYRWFIARAVPVRDADGRITCWFGANTDLDDIARAREVLARGREELEELVAGRTADLLQAVDALHTEVLERERTEEILRQSQKMEAVGQLTGSIAHDFNNMLQGVMGGLDMVHRRITEGRAAEAERYIEASHKAVERAAGLTHRLLAFARRQALDPRPVEANGLVMGVEELIRRTVGAAIEVELRMGDGRWMVLCDANQLENALLNLCINARDAMPDGGRLTIGTQYGLIRRLGAGRCHAARTRRALSRSSFARP